MRASSPASDSGASSLSPVASSAAISLDNLTENQEEGQQHKGGVLSLYARGHTPLSSPSKSGHSSEASPLHHPSGRNVLQDKGIIIFYNKLVHQFAHLHLIYELLFCTTTIATRRPPSHNFFCLPGSQKIAVDLV